MGSRSGAVAHACLAVTLGLLFVFASCVGTPKPLHTHDLAQASLANRGVPGAWRLVWHDEFPGSRIESDHWNYEVDARGGGNNELQYYTDRRENAYVSGGKLHIVARAETYTGPEGTRRFTSARINTKQKGDWTYGRIEVRARLPEGRGLWPAIWMMPTESFYGGWAASGEIDIVELVGHTPGRVYGTLHYGGEWPDNTHVGDSVKLSGGWRFSEDFHVFTLIWEPDAFHWYVDGEHYQSQTSWRTSGHPFPAPFNRDFYLILNVAVGGNWPGPPDETTEFPQEMIVDYVRVFQR